MRVYMANSHPDTRPGPRPGPGPGPAHTTGHSTNGTHDHRQEMNTSNTGKPAYICMIADNEKKYKKVKKIWKYEKTAVPLQKKQQRKTI